MDSSTPGVARLDGKVAVVTGIGPGMGASIAHTLARQGASIVLAARRVERLEAVEASLRAIGAEVAVVPTDIADPESCGRLVDAAVERFGRIDVFVQNGHHEGDWRPVIEADLDDWHHIMEVNFFGAVHLATRIVPVMVAGGGGSIVLVNSGAAVRNPPTMGVYSASKAAMASLARTLALEVGPSGVRVNGIFLGPVQGENLDNGGYAASQALGITLEDFKASKAAELPLRAIPTPDECAGAVLFFASDLSACVTGQHLAVNGGQWIS